MMPLVWSLTRPCPGEWAKRFQDGGAKTVHVPFVRIEPVSDFSVVDSALMNMATYDGLVFTSQHAVRMAADRLKSLGISVSVPIYAVGSSTANQIESLGWKAEGRTHTYTGEGLARWLGRRLARGSRLLFPRSEASRMAPWRGLEEFGIGVDGVDLYRPRPLAHDEGAQVRSIIHGGPAWVVFGSPSGVEGWINIWGSTGKAAGHLDPFKVAVLGETTKTAVTRMGIKPAIVPGKPTVERLCRAIHRKLRTERHEPVG